MLLYSCQILHYNDTEMKFVSIHSLEVLTNKIKPLLPLKLKVMHEWVNATKDDRS